MISRPRVCALSFVLLVTLGALPAAAQLTPTAGPTAGQVTLSYSGSTVQLTDAGLMTVGGRLCPITSTSATSASCTLPEGEGTSLDVVIYEGTGPAILVRDTASFSYYPPSVQDLSPASAGPTSGGTVLTLQGSDFGLNPSVRLGNTSCASVERISHDEVRCVTPEGQGANLLVSVEAAGQSNGNPPNTTYDPPTVEGVNPLYSPTSGGNTITINGTNLA